MHTNYRFEQSFKMSSTKLIVILIIATNMCCALEWSEQMEAFCRYNYFDFVNRTSDTNPVFEFHRKCNHWTLQYDNQTKSFEFLSFDESIQTLRIITISMTNFAICSRLSYLLPKACLDWLSAKYRLLYNVCGFGNQMHLLQKWLLELE